MRVGRKKRVSTKNCCNRCSTADACLSFSVRRKWLLKYCRCHRCYFICINCKKANKLFLYFLIKFKLIRIGSESELNKRKVRNDVALFHGEITKRCVYLHISLVRARRIDDTSDYIACCVSFDEVLSKSLYFNPLIFTFIASFLRFKFLLATFSLFIFALLANKEKDKELFLLDASESHGTMRKQYQQYTRF